MIVCWPGHVLPGRVSDFLWYFRTSCRPLPNWDTPRCRQVSTAFQLFRSCSAQRLPAENKSP